MTQNQVDNAWRNLIKAMQYMEFKEANKDDLAKVIALAEEMNGKLDKYLDEGKPAFTTALTEAKEVYENEIATQEEVTSAWQNLLDAMANMMLKPDKGLLEDLIAQAEGLNEADYEAQSFAVMRTALAAAKEVFDQCGCRSGRDRRICISTEGCDRKTDAGSRYRSVRKRRSVRQHRRKQD